MTAVAESAANRGPSHSLADLIAKLEGASEPSRELDVLISVAAGQIDADLRDLAEEYRWELRAAPDGRRVEAWVVNDAGYERADASRPPRPYTASVDAALALIERVLPGWTVGGISQDDAKAWHVELREGYQTSFKSVAIAPTRFGVRIYSLAIVLCIACLKALQSNEVENG